MFAPSPKCELGEGTSTERLERLIADRLKVASEQLKLPNECFVLSFLIGSRRICLKRIDHYCDVMLTQQECAVWRFHCYHLLSGWDALLNVCCSLQVRVGGSDRL